MLAFPTESSYGLGVDPWNRTGVETIYRIKEREAGKALPVVIAGREQLAGLGIDPDLHIVERSLRLLAGAADRGPAGRAAAAGLGRRTGLWPCGCRITAGCGSCSPPSATG